MHVIFLPIITYYFELLNSTGTFLLYHTIKNTNIFQVFLNPIGSPFMKTLRGLIETCQHRSATAVVKREKMLMWRYIAYQIMKRTLVFTTLCNVRDL